MCGRFAFFCKGQFGYESLQLPEPPPFERYNIAPTQNILAIRTSSETGRPEWALFHWGLVPSWSKESKTKHLLINARAEEIEAKPSYRGPVRHRRCIVPASGFYEWLRQGAGKQPYFVRPAADKVFALAGIWDRWEGKLAVCRALACQVFQITEFPLFYDLALGRGENTKTPKISALRIIAPESPTSC